MSVDSAAASWYSAAGWASWVGSFIWKEEEIAPIDVNIPVFCVVGTPGAGKTGLCARIAKEYNFSHIQLSDLILPQATQQQELTAISVAANDPLSTPTAVQQLREKLKEIMENGEWSGIVVDAFPNNVDSLTTFVDKACAPSGIIYLTCSLEAAQHRLSSTMDPNVVRQYFTTHAAAGTVLLQHLEDTQRFYIHLDCTTLNVDDTFSLIQAKLVRRGVCIHSPAMMELVDKLTETETAEAIHTICKNLVFQDDARYRLLVTNTPRFQKVISDVPYAMRLLAWLGFEKEDDTKLVVQPHNINFPAATAILYYFRENLSEAPLPPAMAEWEKKTKEQKTQQQPTSTTAAAPPLAPLWNPNGPLSLPPPTATQQPQSTTSSPIATNNEDDGQSVRSQASVQLQQGAMEPAKLDMPGPPVRPSWGADGSGGSPKPPPQLSPVAALSPASLA
eukprot:TRINITY_DN112631_c0_g1_i1.p1 TRINITY_DN112631_c0_g1~~TRINITY_DN112631_c0_g1_i1.p1  ORF type:complete len:447 (+),score=65.49 TRINITY_DN112631_c0_g1_i1:27-1367(+)